MTKTSIKLYRVQGGPAKHFRSRSSIYFKTIGPAKVWFGNTYLLTYLLIYYIYYSLTSIVQYSIKFELGFLVPSYCHPYKLTPIFLTFRMQFEPICAVPWRLLELWRLDCNRSLNVNHIFVLDCV